MWDKIKREGAKNMKEVSNLSVPFLTGRTTGKRTEKSIVLCLVSLVNYAS